MAVTKNDIVNSVYAKLNLPKNKSVQVVESLLEIMKKTLTTGEDVMITGFGKFCVKNKKERRGRNPQTKEDLTLRSRRVVVFKCSAILRDRINGKN